jgi:hypothetical protein
MTSTAIASAFAGLRVDRISPDGLANGKELLGSSAANAADNTVKTKRQQT